MEYCWDAHLTEKGQAQVHSSVLVLCSFLVLVLFSFLPMPMPVVSPLFWNSALLQ